MEASYSISFHGARKCVLLAPGDNFIGRSHAPLGDDPELQSLSRDHAVIRLDQTLNMLLFKPLSKTNYCYYNGKALVRDTWIPLNDGNVIHLGKDTYPITIACNLLNTSLEDAVSAHKSVDAEDSQEKEATDSEYEEGIDDLMECSKKNASEFSDESDLLGPASPPALEAAKDSPELVEEMLPLASERGGKRKILAKTAYGVYANLNRSSLKKSRPDMQVYCHCLDIARCSFV